jgi:DHA1 family inner membrane transport protein
MSSRLPLIALAVSAFAIGTTEFVVMGLLQQMAADLGVSIPAAGMLVSGYAMGVVVGGPLLALATARLPRKTVLLVLMGVFVFGNVLCALAPNYEILMVARVIASLAHGSFFGAGAVVAGHIAAPGRRTQAIALMFAGLTIANIFGVPAGTVLGQALGWRSTFWAVSVLGVIALAVMARYVPRLEAMPPPRLRQELRRVVQLPVLVALGMTVFGFGGVFTVFTYIDPILTHQAGLDEHAISRVLVLFGIGATIGTLLGGRLADRRLMRSITLLLAALCLFFLVFASLMGSAAGAVAGVFLIGVLGFAANPGLQARSMQQAHDAPLLASTLNQSAFNLGNAGGAWLGASMLAHGAIYPQLSYAAAVVTAGGIGLTLLSVWLERRGLRSRAATSSC